MSVNWVRLLAPVFGVLLVSGCGRTQTVTKEGNVTTTVVQDGQWLTALISALAVLVSAALTAWTTSHFTRRAEQDRRLHESRQAADTRTREQIVAVAQSVSTMLREFRLLAGRAATETNVEAAETYEECAVSVTRHHDEALPAVEVMADAVLRTLANEVFTSHGRWASEMADAVTNAHGSPSGSELHPACEAFFARARQVLRDQGDGIGRSAANG